jgi:hypothetical protein
MNIRLKIIASQADTVLARPDALRAKYSVDVKNVYQKIGKVRQKKIVLS